MRTWREEAILSLKHVTNQRIHFAGFFLFVCLFCICINYFAKIQGISLYISFISKVFYCLHTEAPKAMKYFDSITYNMHATLCLTAWAHLHWLDSTEPFNKMMPFLSIQQGLNGTRVVQLDETRKNRSNSKCVCVFFFFFWSGTSYSINQRSLKVNRCNRKCHFGEKPCGISLVNCLWLCELDEFQWSSCCSFIKGSSSWSIALSCLTEITEMIGNKRQNHSPCIMFQMKETKSVLRARV